MDDQTQYQTAGGQTTSKQLSMQATTPPSEVPGYRLQRFLGAGAFGQVWVGQDLNTGRSVAVKFYLHRGGVNWSLLSREVKNLVQLSADRHVVQVLEVGWDADPPYYVMELIGGGSLEDLLQVRGRLPVEEAVELFRKICMGLNHCHAKGVLHCDIKPANILLGQDNDPRLADFGQSRMSQDQTPALGTLFYMAPEQADLDSPPDASWDVYAVGAILYRLLCGVPPHRDDTLVQHIDTADSLPKRLRRYREAIVNSPPPVKHLTGSGVDRALARIVSRCLAADPKNRYANVQQILQDLNRRDESRAARPLMLLGIVGPLLLLTATCIFAYRSIDRATLSTMSALRTEAFGSNQLAAKFAARTLEGELERYFELTRKESDSPDFREQLTQVFDREAITDALDEITSPGTPDGSTEMTEARDRLLDDLVRKQLDQYLAGRLSRYTDQIAHARRPRLATMFVTDAKGTIVSIAYSTNVSRDENSAGRNYAYRTYYHGGRNDLDRTKPIDSIKPLNSTHLSSAFTSTATHLWKVAVSTPVYLTEESEQAELPDAVFVVTINLGDVELPQSDRGFNQVAVMVEARDGPLRGTVLQHPLMDVRRRMGQTLADEKFQLSGELMDRLLKGGDVNYIDPVARSDDGAVYAGEWIAAMHPVRLPVDPDDDASPAPNDSLTTDLLVLVQYRLDTVFAPVGEMRSSLFFQAAAAIASILFVTFALWMFVRRVSDTKLIPDESARLATGDTQTITVQ